MANPDRPNGAVPFGEPLRLNSYVAGAAVYPGDFVKLDSSGRIVVGAATDALIGVAIDYASAAAASVLVADHPDQQFVVQADETEIDAQTDVGQNADILATAANTTYKVSRMELDSSTIASDSTLALRILGVEAAVDNAFGAQAKCIVRINKHQLASNSQGV